MGAKGCRDIDVPDVRGSRCLQVRARAESLACSSDNKDSAFVAGRLIDRVMKQLHRCGIDGVSPFRTVERDSFDPVLQSDYELVTGGHEVISFQTQD
jgi:hypothetical protein